MLGGTTSAARSTLHSQILSLLDFTVAQAIKHRPQHRPYINQLGPPEARRSEQESIIIPRFPTPTVSELKTAKASTYPPNIHRFCVNLFDTMSFSLSSSTATTTCRSLRNAAPSARTLPSLPLGTRARSPTLRPWRAFASSAGRELAVSEMSERDFASLKVDQDRLMNDIHTTSEWGKGEPWGE